MNLRPLSQGKLVRMTFFSVQFTFQYKTPTFEVIFTSFQFSPNLQNQNKRRVTFFYINSVATNISKTFWYLELIFFQILAHVEPNYVYFWSLQAKNLSRKKCFKIPKIDEILVKLVTFLGVLWREIIFRRFGKYFVLKSFKIFLL